MAILYIFLKLKKLVTNRCPMTISEILLSVCNFVISKVFSTVCWTDFTTFFLSSDAQFALEMRYIRFVQL